MKRNVVALRASARKHQAPTREQLRQFTQTSKKIVEGLKQKK